MKPDHSIHVIIGLVTQGGFLFLAPMMCLYFSQSGGIAERTVLPAKKAARGPRRRGFKGYLQLNENSMGWEKSGRG